MLGLGLHVGLKWFYVWNEVKTRTNIPENRYGNASTSRSDQVIKRGQQKKPRRRSSRRNYQNDAFLSHSTETKKELELLITYEKKSKKH